MLVDCPSKLWKPCLAWVVICLVVSWVAGWVTGHNIESWYVHLVKPAYNPPAWVFAPVWTILYILIGISGGLLWAERQQRPLTWWIYIAQLVLNFAWSFIFFGAHAVGLALADIVVLWLMVLATIILAYQHRPVVSWLLLPYWLWVSFAAMLNSALYALNA